MTPLEEKIYRKAEMLLNDFKNQRVNFSGAIDTIQSIANQAVEEWKKENLCLDCVRLYEIRKETK